MHISSILRPSRSYKIRHPTATSLQSNKNNPAIEHFSLILTYNLNPENFNTMSENKTKPTRVNVNDFLNQIENPVQKQDMLKIINMMKKITGEEPELWGDSIIGFGKYRYKYASGREGDWFLTGVSPRKNNTTLYLNYGFENNADLMDKLGKYKTGKACLYIKKLDDIDEAALKELISRSAEEVKKRSHV